MAKEMNLSETAFLVRQDDGFNLRWFTPAVEVPLCGHATLASAHVLWTEGHLPLDQEARFYTVSGVLIARLQEDWIELNFPANPSTPVSTPPPALAEALGTTAIQQVWENSMGYLVEVDTEATVRHLHPNLALVKTMPGQGVIVTSRGDSEFDFVSRFFAPALGIDEDPVTGAAHCCLGPYWRDRLGKSEFLAYQASARGGVVKVSCEGDRVLLGGQAITVMRGELTL